MLKMVNQREKATKSIGQSTVTTVAFYPASDTGWWRRQRWTRHMATSAAFQPRPETCMPARCFPKALTFRPKASESVKSKPVGISSRNRSARPGTSHFRSLNRESMEARRSRRSSLGAVRTTLFVKSAFSSMARGQGGSTLDSGIAPSFFRHAELQEKETNYPRQVFAAEKVRIRRRRGGVDPGAMQNATLPKNDLMLLLRSSRLKGR